MSSSPISDLYMREFCQPHLLPGSLTVSPLSSLFQSNSGKKNKKLRPLRREDVQIPRKAEQQSNIIRWNTLTKSSRYAELITKSECRSVELSCKECSRKIDR